MQVVTDTFALLIAALSVFADRQTPIMAILLMLLIEVRAPNLSAGSMCVPPFCVPLTAPTQHIKQVRTFLPKAQLAQKI